MNNETMKRLSFFAIALIIVLSCHAQLRFNLGNNSPIRKLQIAEMAITNLYVDTVDESKLVEDAIRGMLKELDPHSTYATPKEVKAMNEPLQGNFDGIGVQFNMIEDTLIVIQPVVNGPSEKVGIMPGDRIVSVNDTAIAGVKMSKEDIMKRLRGKKGTQVKLGVVRRGIADQLTFIVTRDKIPVKSIDAVYMVRPGIGYIRITNFGATTYDEFTEGVRTLQQQGMKDLLLDLQDLLSIRRAAKLASGPSTAPKEMANWWKERWWCSSTSSLPRQLKSSPAPSKTRTVAPWWAAGRTAKDWFSAPSTCPTAR